MGFDPARARQAFPLLRRENIHYLDNAATSQMPDSVLDALRRFQTEQRANIHGGVHRLARAAIAAYEGARAAIAAHINAEPGEIIFTYGATSAINLLAHSYGELLNRGDEIVISVLEHHSNILPWQMLARRRGIVLRVLPMTPDGRLDLDALPETVSERCRLLALTHCSNVTGALTDVAPIVDAARAVGAMVMLDGAQRIPHGPVDVKALGIDFYAFSGHKMFGPTGIGVLWGRRALLDDMPPFLVGGQMIERVTLDSATFAKPPRRFEAGTPPIAAAIGLGAAVRWMEGLDWPAVAAHERRLAKHILDGMAAIDGVRTIGPTDVEMRRGVISFHVEGLDISAICRELDVHGVAVRCGHHCAQPLLAAFGLDATGRASIALYTDDSDADAFLEALDNAVRKLRGTTQATG